MKNYLRKSSEAIILFLIAVTPWAFGAIHPFFRYCVAAGISLTLVFWAIELLITPKSVFTRFQIPIIVLVLLAYLQILPLGEV